MSTSSQNSLNVFDRVGKDTCVCLSYFCAKTVAVR